MSSGRNLKRIINEKKKMKEFAEEDKSLYDIIESTDDIYHYEAIIKGQIDSLYVGYQFKVDIELPNDYPTSPMKMKFITPIQHVNISETGDICLDILNKQWSPVLSIRTVLVSLISLLGDPNFIDPFNNNLAALYRENKDKYEAKIRKACVDHATKIDVK